ncbi:MAG: hypothetical protein ACE37B_06305 [Ilumatobacter sp.]|jgi:hypothetical protein|uniref:hypothetical protein n=1 Tax=Ilumatobacter sp. TaxID=1967498 RepID=UPI00391D5FD8
MAAFVIIVLLLALLGVLGAIVEGLLWLALAALILLIVGVALGWWKLRDWRTR